MRSSICLAAILLSGVATEALAQQTSESTSSNGMKLHIGAGTSALFLPDVKFTTLTNGIVTEYRGQLTDLSGRVDGTRVDLGLEGIPLGHALTFGVKGFFADMSASNSAECTADLNLIQPMCIDPPFWDPDKYIQGDFAGFVTSDWEIRTERRVQNWGLALELQPRQVHTVGSLKDEPVEVVKPSPWRLGLAARGIDENTSLDAYDPQDPVHLRESINTGYYGAYIGYANAVRLDAELVVRPQRRDRRLLCQDQFQGPLRGRGPLWRPRIRGSADEHPPDARSVSEQGRRHRLDRGQPHAGFRWRRQPRSHRTGRLVLLRAGGPSQQHRLDALAPIPTSSARTTAPRSATPARSPTRSAAGSRSRCRTDGFRGRSICREFTHKYVWRGSRHLPRYICVTVLMLFMVCDLYITLAFLGKIEVKIRLTLD